MFAVGDKVVVIALGDSFFGDKGEVTETFESNSGWQSLGVVVENTEACGSPVLWFSHNEIEKVEG